MTAGELITRLSTFAPGDKVYLIRRDADYDGIVLDEVAEVEKLTDADDGPGAVLLTREEE